VNEVESNLDASGDWVELHNAGDRAFDLAGYVFRDNDGTRGYVLPAGSVIPAGGYLVLSDAQFGFGLGAADQARCSRPTGSPVDQHEWAAHAATTYGRCPTGAAPSAPPASPPAARPTTARPSCA
jgi:hypothetical protein